MNLTRVIEINSTTLVQTKKINFLVEQYDDVLFAVQRYQ